MRGKQLQRQNGRKKNLETFEKGAYCALRKKGKKKLFRPSMLHDQLATPDS